MFDFSRITLFSLEKRPAKHKITVFSKNFWGMAPLVPLATPMPVINGAGVLCRAVEGGRTPSPT